MKTARISDLLEPFLERPLAQFQLEQISTYIDLLLRWNARINLTAIRSEDEIVTRHFGESLFMARHLFPSAPSADRSASPSADPSARRISTPTTEPAPQQNLEICHPERSQAKSEAIGPAQSKDPYLPTAPSSPHPQVVDIGSGAGFPALPLKLWSPHIHLTMIESNHKKATFLREVTRTLTLTNIDIITGRAETAAQSLNGSAEVVTLRAVERFEAILLTAAEFLAPGATLALLIGVSQLSHLTTLSGFKCCDPIPVPLSESRVLAIRVRT